MGCHGNHAFSHSPNQFFLRTPSFRIQGVTINNLAPIKIVLGVHGNLNWMPGYGSLCHCLFGIHFDGEEIAGCFAYCIIICVCARARVCVCARALM